MDMFLINFLFMGVAKLGYYNKKYLGHPQSDQNGIKDNITEYEQNIRIFTYCSALGGGACVTPVGVEYVMWPYKVSKFITRLKKVVLHNPEYTGLRFYTDAGPDGLCPNSIGVEKDFYVGLSSSATENPAKVAFNGVLCSGAVPYDIEFSGRQLPQPIDIAWNAYIYVYVWWGDSLYINAGSAFKDLSMPIFELVKIDCEMKI